MKRRTMIGAIAALLFIIATLAARVVHAQSADSGAQVPKCIPNIPSAGDVLVTAGEDANSDPTSVTTEFFHVATGAWKTGCPGKFQHDEGQLLPFKGGLLEMGGELLKRDRLHDHLMTRACELYNPTTGKFKPGPLLRTATEDAAAVVLGDGTLVIAGGVTSNDKELPLRTIETLKKGTWKTLKAKLSTPRGGACAAVMTAGPKAGQVLIVGGTNAAGETEPEVASADLYNPATGKVTPTTSPMSVVRGFPNCTALNDGTVLVTGGIANSGLAYASAEIYDPTTDSFSSTQNDMSVPRVGHTTTLLNDEHGPGGRG